MTQQLPGLDDFNGGAGAGGSAAKGVGQGSAAVPAIASIPSPVDDSLLWIQVGIGPFTFPLIRGQGTAIVKARSKQKVDQQKAAGKSKAKSKQAGVEPCPVSIALKWRARIGPDGKDSTWPIVEAMLTGIDPNGPSKGGPFEFKYPDANRRNVKSILVLEVGSVDWEPGGWVGSCTITGEEWEIPKKAAAGVGTGTPKKASQWYEVDKQTTKVNPDGTVTLTKSTPQKKGWDGTGAPNSSP